MCWPNFDLPRLDIVTLCTFRRRSPWQPVTSVIVAGFTRYSYNSRTGEDARCPFTSKWATATDVCTKSPQFLERRCLGCEEQKVVFQCLGGFVPTLNKVYPIKRTYRTLQVFRCRLGFFGKSPRCEPNGEKLTWRKWLPSPKCRLGLGRCSCFLSGIASRRGMIGNGVPWACQLRPGLISWSEQSIRDCCKEKLG